MSQVVRDAQSIVESGSAEGSIANIDGMVFGKVEFKMADGSAIPGGITFQLEISTQKTGSHFEVAKDASNADVAALSVTDTSRIFNIPVETMAARRLRVKLGGNLSGSINLIAMLTLFDNQ